MKVANKEGKVQKTQNENEKRNKFNYRGKNR